MDVAQLLSVSTDYEADEENHSSSPSSCADGYATRASAGVAFDPETLPVSASSLSHTSIQSISPCARPISTKSVKAKRASSASSASTSSSGGSSPLALATSPASGTTVRSAKEPSQPQPPQKRNRNRIEQWARYTTLFQIRSFVNSSMTLLPSDPAGVTVQCIGRFEGRLSRQAIETVFPRILHDEELAKRVLESKFICPATTLLYFDASGTVVRYDAHADIFEGLNMLLASNPRDVMTMMANARIGDASMIPSDRDDDDIVSISSSPPREERFTVVEKETEGGDAENNRHSVEFLLS